MEEGEGGKDLLATTLQDRLTKFASSETEEREKALPELVAFIKDGVDKEVLEKLTDKEFQPKLQDSVNRALQTKFKKHDGTEIEPWQGGHTVVVLDRDGKVKGAVSVDTEGLEEYGDLNKYALIKALCELHLYKDGREQGLSDPDNFTHLLSLGLKAGDDLFTGSVWQEDLNHEVTFVGSSGCAPKRDYLRELLAGAEPTRDTQAGLFDSVFSSLTANNLLGGHLPRKQIYSEPQEIQQLRINN